MTIGYISTKERGKKMANNRVENINELTIKQLETLIRNIKEDTARLAANRRAFQGQAAALDHLAMALEKEEENIEII